MHVMRTLAQQVLVQSVDSPLCRHNSNSLHKRYPHFVVIIIKKSGSRDIESLAGTRAAEAERKNPLQAQTLARVNS